MNNQKGQKQTINEIIYDYVNSGINRSQNNGEMEWTDGQMNEH